MSLTGRRSGGSIRLRRTILAVSLVVISTTRLFAAPQVSQASESNPGNVYNQLLDQVFPFDPTGHDSDVFTVSVLFVFASQPEARISISLKRGKDATVDYSVADRNIGSALTGTSGHPIDIGSIAKSVTISRQSVKMPSAVAVVWQQQLLSALGGSAKILQTEARDYSKAGAIMLTVDADTYRVTYIQNQTRLSIDLTESQAESTGGVDPSVSVTAWCKALAAAIKR